MSFILNFKFKNNRYELISNINEEIKIIDKSSYLIGYIANKEIDEIKEIIKHKISDEELKKIVGEFIIIQNNGDSINIINDRLGKLPSILFRKDNDVFITDDLWSISSTFKLSFSDLDVQSIKESIIFVYPLFNNTILKDAKFIPPACVLTINENDIKNHNYWDYKLEKSDKSFEEKCVTFTNNIKEMIQYINVKHSPKSIGFGLSGGLDSRLIPKFLKETKNKIIAFILGKPKPFGILKSVSLRNAQKIADFYNLNLLQIDTEKEDYHCKSQFEIINSPLSSSQLFISSLKVLSLFDVLITGASGMIIGSTLPKDIREISKEELIDRIFKYFQFGKKKSLIDKIYEAIIYIICKGVTVEKKINDDYYLKIFNENELLKVKNKIIEFVEENSHLSNVEIWLKYINFNWGTKNSFGFFESFCKSKKSFSIYYPFTFDFLISLSEEDLIDRKFLKEYLSWIDPKLMSIKSQKYSEENRRKFKNGGLYRLFNIINYTIRGNGLEYYKLGNKKKFKKFANDVFNENKSGWFFKILKYEECIYFLKNNSRAYENLVKLKKIIDKIEKDSKRW